MNKIHILTNYNKIVGNGNYLRCLEIKKNINKKFKSKIFKIDKLKDFKKEKINLANILLIDIPNLNNHLFKKIEDLKKKTIFLDYFGNRSVKNNILIFDHSLKKKRKFSLSNSIIRKELIKDNSLNKKGISLNKKVLNKKIVILLLLGSYDLKGYSKKVIDLLLNLDNKNINIELITKKKEDKIYFKKKIYRKIKLHFKKKNISKILSKADIVISNGGTSCLEGIYFKKIVIALGQNKKETIFAKYLKSKNYIFGDRLQDIHKLLSKNIKDVKHKLKFPKLGNGINVINNLLNNYAKNKN